MEKEIGFISNGKDVIINSIVGGLSGEHLSVEMNQSNYATKADLKGATHIETSTLASKAKLASFKTNVANLDVAKLKTIPADLSKLSNVVDDDVVKKKLHIQ